MDSLLKNAALSLKMGIEDYECEEPERALSAVRNVTAGVLLLFKEKLRLLSPPESDEVLLKERIKPFVNDGGTISFKGTGRKSVDKNQIKERFKDLGVSVDWKKVDRIVDIRNDIEHYYSGETEGWMRELVSDTFLLIRDFFATQLLMQPSDVLDAKTWATILETAEVYEKEKQECQAELNKVNWPSSEVDKIAGLMRCGTCSSELIKPLNAYASEPAELQLKCTSCGNVNEFGEIIDSAIEEYYAFEAYIAVKEGADPPYNMCPSCAQHTYLYETGSCVVCGYELEYSECAICGQSLSIEEQEYEGICSYHNYVMEKERDS